MFEIVQPRMDVNFFHCLWEENNITLINHAALSPKKKTNRQATMLQTLIEEITSANELQMHHLVNRCYNSFEKAVNGAQFDVQKNDVQFIRRRTMGIPVFHHQKL